MIRSLSFKLTLAFLLVGLIGIGVVEVVAYRRTTQAFSQFVYDQNRTQAVTVFADFYAQKGGWADFQELPPPYGPPGGGFQVAGNPPPGLGMPRFQRVLTDANGRILLEGMGYRLGDILPFTEQTKAEPIVVDGQTVGYLLLSQRNAGIAPAEAAFLRQVNQLLLLGAIGGTAVALLLGGLLAQTLTRPLAELTRATQIVAQGQLGEQVPVRSQDELGQLARSFNQMSTDLAHASQLRRQLTADIAHDLRTPLSIILGYTESLNDGVLKPSPNTLHIIHDEALHLSRLVEDLRTLSRAEAGELPLMRYLVDPAALLERTAAAYRPLVTQEGITLKVETEAALPELLVDPDRMVQVLNNLVSNALRYTPNGGSITLSAKRVATAVELAVADTGSGIAAADLPYIFDRFYRGDASRQNSGNESGLGLAIAKTLVELQNGRIRASSLPGQGATFTIVLPLPVEVASI